MFNLTKFFRIANIEFYTGNFRDASLIFSQCLNNNFHSTDNLFLHQKLIASYVADNNFNQAYLHSQIAKSLMNHKLKFVEHDSHNTSSYRLNNEFTKKNLKINLDILNNLTDKLEKELFKTGINPYKKDGTNDKVVDHSCLVQIIDQASRSKGEFEMALLNISSKYLNFYNLHEDGLYVSQFIYKNQLSSKIAKLKAVVNIAKYFININDISNGTIASAIALKNINDFLKAESTSTEKDNILELKSNLMDFLNIKAKTKTIFSKEVLEDLAKSHEDSEIFNYQDNQEISSNPTSSMFFEIAFSSGNLLESDNFLNNIPGSASDFSESAI